MSLCRAAEGRWLRGHQGALLLASFVAFTLLCRPMITARAQPKATGSLTSSGSASAEPKEPPPPASPEGPPAAQGAKRGEEPDAPLLSEERLLSIAEEWFQSLNGLGLTYSGGTSTISASADAGSFTKGLVAKGSAETQSLTLSLYRHPQPGWGWSTDGDLSYLSSEIKDFEGLELPQPTGGDERFVNVLCQPISIDGELRGGFSTCELSNRYQLTLISASYGLWGGYYWPLLVDQDLRGHLKLGVAWRPLSFRWVRASMADYMVSDELSWSWLGVVRAGALARLFISERLGLGLSLDLEWTPSVPFEEPLEFRGARSCDERSCQRERVFVDQLSILSPSFGVHLIWLWSVR